MTSDVKCPLCGSQTTLRTAKKGPDSGKQFHVCNRYPECKWRIKYQTERAAVQDHHGDANLGSIKGKGRYSKTAYVLSYILMGLGFLMLIGGLFTFDITQILFWSGLSICFLGFFIWVGCKFIAADYHKKSSTARKRGAAQAALGLLLLVIFGLVNFVIYSTGWIVGGFLVFIGAFLVITGLYRLISGRG